MAEAVQPTPYIGRPLRRREDHKFVTGKGRYVDDTKLPGTLYLGILRSPHAHARITGIDLSAARAAAGVRLALPVLTSSKKSATSSPTGSSPVLWCLPVQ